VHTVAVPPATGTTVIHLALDPAPPLTRVAEVTDLLRAAAMSRLGHWHGDSMLAGKTAYGDCMRGRRHAHAHWLPVTDGRVVAGICVWTPGGLDPREAAAVLAVRHAGSPGVRGPVPCMRVEHVPGDHPVPFSGQAARWESLTPFVPPLRRGKPSRRTPAYLHDMVARELAGRGLPEPVTVEELGPVTGWRTMRPSRPEWVPPPCRIRITFTEPAAGPLAIGRLSHFGLGLMRPAP
jgi:CRISPR-associated protein Csb2